jgi:hypothetical protein
MARNNTEATRIILLTSSSSSSSKDIQVIAEGSLAIGEGNEDSGKENESGTHWGNRWM